MGRITYRDRDSNFIAPLAARTVIGRAPQCLLRLRWGFISREHAVIEHQHGGYWLKLLSRNGLKVCGRTVEVGEYVPIKKSDTITFGCGQDAPELAVDSDAPPQLVAHELRTGALVAAEPGTPLALRPPEDIGGDAVEIHSADGRAGAYTVRGAGEDGTRTLSNEEVVVVGGAIWMVHLPSDDTRTSNLESQPLDLDRCQLRLTTDEGGDSVVVSLLCRSSGVGPINAPERIVVSRARCASTLLALAEKKQRDLREGVPERCAGWVTNDELRALLGCRPDRDENLPYLHPFRLRRMFEAANIRGLAQLFERDQGSIRLGVSDFKITIL